ncbi:hypothetical protein HPB50_007464 [Hyalomma asiaticum]|uniref:Uncharacterized protein n=1 Tax=Hyalomma asiaticum TaxID=266040 RepID=A0ACB7TEC1_HYAAI|nr:hypothetical protein HPB50_007464 [Hyalomma asiaticum]
MHTLGDGERDGHEPPSTISTVVLELQRDILPTQQSVLGSGQAVQVSISFLIVLGQAEQRLQPWPRQGRPVLRSSSGRAGPPSGIIGHRNCQASKLRPVRI